jgi:hypothetical protein
MATSRWPVLVPIEQWQDTRDTVQLWTQVIGKVRMALEPMVNHWWQVPLYVSARGLTTSLMHTHGTQAGGVGLEIEFDFITHRLELRTTGGEQRHVALEPRPVADFYGATMAALDDLGVEVDIYASPVELVESIPFAQDTVRASYDADAMHQFWLALVQADRVLDMFRSRFIGKVSPVHFFWGAFDLACTRFSGRTAPSYAGAVPNCPQWVMTEAYSHEVSSCGFWPGGSAEASFYSYAYPGLVGFSDWPVPSEVSYDESLGEFLLPYDAVRTAADPDLLVLNFLQATYDAAAELGHWDRPVLDARLPNTTPTNRSE